MIEVVVEKLRKGDRFKFRKDGVREYTVENRHAARIPDVTVLVLDVEGDVTVPLDVQVYATSMYRAVTVPCLGHEVRMLWDMASGPPPIRVVCEDCDKRVTDAVMTQVDRPEPKRHDRVLLDGREATIAGFDEDRGTRLSDGTWVCASDFEFVEPRVWRYAPAGRGRELGEAGCSESYGPEGQS